MGAVQRYRDAAGHVFSLTAEHAKRVGGFTLVEGNDKPEEAEPEAKARKVPPATKQVAGPPTTKSV